MDDFEAIIDTLMNNPAVTALEAPDISTDGDDTAEPPFFGSTAAAFQESFGEVRDFAEDNLTSYAARTALVVRDTAQAYSNALGSVADRLQGLVPAPENGTGGNAPGMATFEALAVGLDGLGEAVALSLGDQTDYGVVYAAKTIGDASVSASEDIAAGFATGADMIEAVAFQIDRNIPDDAPGTDPDPEGQFVEALEAGFEDLTASYNTLAEVLLGEVPDGIATGVETVGMSFLNGTQDVTMAIAEQIDGFDLLEGNVLDNIPELPGGGGIDPVFSPNDLLGLVQENAFAPVSTALMLEDFALPVGDLLPV